MEKFYSLKTCLKMAGGGMHPVARTDNNVSYNYANQPIWLQYDVGQILTQLFYMTARTALAQFGQFTLKTRVRFQKEEFRPPLPPGCAIVTLSLITNKTIAALRT